MKKYSKIEYKVSRKFFLTVIKEKKFRVQSQLFALLPRKESLISHSPGHCFNSDIPTVIILVAF